MPRGWAPARVDANQKAIVKTLREMGASVLHLHKVGSGAPDLLCGHYGKDVLIECKDGSKPPSQQKLTPLEQKFHDEWRGNPVCIVRSVEDAVELIKYMRKYLARD